VLRRLSDISRGAVEASEKDKLEKFSIIVEDGVGFDLYESVETTKRRLSEEESVSLRFDYPGAELTLDVKRGELERSAQPPVQRIVAALNETLAAGGLSHTDVDILCLTGGTSRMPLIEQALCDCLPNANLRRLKSFHSVVHGLARHAERLSHTPAA
jgi:hypothetical chaperone protein